MNRNRMLIGVVIAIIIALLASHYVYRRLQTASTAVKPVAVSPVVVASQPLPLGTSLQPQQLRLIEWPSSAQPQGTFSKIQDCVGRALITSVVPNEPILEQKLAPKEAGAGLPAAIPEGMRAVSVRVDDVVDVAGFVQPSSMVDVLVTGNPTTSGSANNTLTRTILEDVRVLAAGQQVEQDKNGKPHTVNVVTLLVTPEQADTLTLASTEGRIHLALRNTIDTKTMDPPPVYLSTLFMGGGEPAAFPTHHRRAVRPRPRPPAPAAPYVIDIYQGDKRETTSFPTQSR